MYMSICPSQSASIPHPLAQVHTSAGADPRAEVTPTPSSSSLQLSSLALTDTKVYGPEIRGAATNFCEGVVLKSRTVPNGATLSCGGATWPGKSLRLLLQNGASLSSLFNYFRAE